MQSVRHVSQPVFIHTLLHTSRSPYSFTRLSIGLSDVNELFFQLEHLDPGPRFMLVPRHRPESVSPVLQSSC